MLQKILKSKMIILKKTNKQNKKYVNKEKELLTKKKENYINNKTKMESF